MGIGIGLTRRRKLEMNERVIPFTLADFTGVCTWRDESKQWEDVISLSRLS